MNFLDLFAGLVPLPVSRALSAYNGKKDALVSEELDKLRTATSNLNEYVLIVNLLITRGWCTVYIICNKYNIFHCNGYFIYNQFIVSNCTHIHFANVFTTACFIT